MPKDFTITKVSSNPPTPWKNGISYYKVMLEGVPVPQEIGKKSVPTVGQTVYGEMIDGKFKRMDKPQDLSFGMPPREGNNAPVKPAYQPKDEAAIKAMWSIGQAMTTQPTGGGVNFEQVEDFANQLFAMVSRVKAGDSNVNGSGGDTPSREQQPAPDLPPVENYDNVPTDLEDEVDLDDIPF